MARAEYESEIGLPSRSPFPVDELDVPWPDALQMIAAAIPGRIAIDDGAQAVTYADLVRRVNRVAHAILDRDARTDDPVAVVARQGVGAVVAFLAPLHAGRLSVPIDAAEPAERQQRMLDASGATTIVTERRHRHVVRALETEHRRIITIEETGAFDDMPPVVSDGRVQGFVVFTSGSTGAPKGVLIAHEHLALDMSAQCDTTAFPLDARVPLITSFGFSAAIGQVLYPLFLGATICPFDLPGGSARKLAEWVRRERITTLQIVPSLMRALASLEPPVEMQSVQMVTLSGETTYGRDIEQARKVFGTDTVFINAFGSTEAYTVASHTVGPGDIPDDGPLPVGSLSPGVTATVVDVDTGEPVPDGEPGRLVAVADYLSRGYWDDPELTAANYFVAPDGRRGFRTSDLVRFRLDGTLEHLGRLDARVKVRGAMVSTDEVERAVLALDGVADAVVVGAATADGGTRLAAYVVGDGSAVLSPSTLRRDLASSVPTTMLPSSFVVVSKLPRTVRGKVDRNALPPLPVPPPFREPVGKER